MHDRSGSYVIAPARSGRSRPTTARWRDESRRRRRRALVFSTLSGFAVRLGVTGGTCRSLPFRVVTSTWCPFFFFFVIVFWRSRINDATSVSRGAG
ncbi:unnamed protein product [Ixodes persulcatus]